MGETWPSRCGLGGASGSHLLHPSPQEMPCSVLSGGFPSRAEAVPCFSKHLVLKGVFTQSYAHVVRTGLCSPE